MTKQSDTAGPPISRDGNQQPSETTDNPALPDGDAAPSEEKPPAKPTEIALSGEQFWKSLAKFQKLR